MADEINGDATVDSTDYAAFLAAYTSERYAPQYDPALDVDGDHRVFNSDYSAFLADEGTSETYTQTGAPFLTVPITGSTVLQDCSPWTNVTNDLYYSNQGQVLETRANGTVTAQSVWGLDYVNDLVAYDTNSTSGSLGGSGLGQRLYAQHDANYDVTALTNTSGAVLERYEYTPYGTVTVLNPDGTVLGDGTMASSQFGVPYLFQGMRYDSFTGLYETPNRDLNPATGTWLQADPAGYVDGSDRYQAFRSRPASSLDPMGTTITDEGLADDILGWEAGYFAGEGLMPIGFLLGGPPGAVVAWAVGEVGVHAAVVDVMQAVHSGDYRDSTILTTCAVATGVPGLQDVANAREAGKPTQQMTFTKWQRGPDFENPAAQAQGFRYKGFKDGTGVWYANATKGADHAFEEWYISYDELGTEHVDVYYYDCNGHLIHY
jgi:RHS repeat-associated protein